MHDVAYSVGSFDRIPLMFIDWNPIETQRVHVLIASLSLKHVLRVFPKDFSLVLIVGRGGI